MTPSAGRIYTWRLRAAPRGWNGGFPFHDFSKWSANRGNDSSVQRFGERPYGRREKLISALLKGAFAQNSRSRGAKLHAVARRRSHP